MVKNKRTIDKKDLSRTEKEKQLSKLTDRDYEALLSIYNFRCLSFDQIYERHYKYSQKKGNELVVNDTTYAKRKIKSLLSLELIDEMYLLDKNIPVLYKLTTLGINILRKQFCWPDNIYDDKGLKHSKGYLTESELNIKEKNAAHQYCLNCFVLRLEEIYKHNKFLYEDERHINSFVGIRPDGIFTTNNTVFFLEMDMGTENAKQLSEKWDHYREFMNSNEYLFRERRIVVLFIVDGIVRINQRINLIKDTINKHFIDCFAYDIELYINTADKLVEFMETENNDLYDMNDMILKNTLENKFRVIDNIDKIKEYFSDIPFSLFARQTINGQNYDYLFENFDNEPMSGIYKASFFDKITNNFRANNNSNLRLILVCESIDIAYSNYKVFELDYTLFTTFDRIATLPFNEAIISFSRNGDVFNFKDNTLNQINPIDFINIKKA